MGLVRHSVVVDVFWICAYRLKQSCRKFLQASDRVSGIWGGPVVCAMCSITDTCESAVTRFSRHRHHSSAFLTAQMACTSTTGARRVERVERDRNICYVQSATIVNAST